MNSLIDKIISLIKIKGDQVKLELISKFSTFLALSILFFTLVILSLLMLIFLSLGIAVIFNEFLMSAYWGYFIASAFFFLDDHHGCMDDQIWKNSKLVRGSDH